jgi:dephospho-CoA kinase
MKTLGLTGGVGMGKSTTGGLLLARGIPVVDTDELARQVVEPGEPALNEVREAFGEDIIGRDGRLHRGELAKRVFAEPAARLRLESILHPRIRQLWHAQVEAWRAEGRPAAVVIIPLLFETKAEAELDATICVACSPVSQRERLVARGWSAEQIAQRIEAQWPVEKKITLSDYVIWTEGDPALQAEQLDRILATLKG